MINITDENLIKVITNPGRTFTGKILLGTNTYSSILNIKYKAPFSASGALSIGETPSAMIDVEMTDISPNLRGMELEAVISIEGQDFSQGLFTVDEPMEKDGVVKFTAYDRMNGASGKTYVSELAYPTTVQTVFDEVCAQLGYTAEAVAEGDNIEVTADVLSGYDCRTALGYLAAYIGKNCVCGTDGVFRMKGFTVQNVTVDEDTVSEAETGKQVSAPRYLSCTVAQDIVYTAGEGARGVSFVCPLMTQERLDSIFSDLIGTEETPGVLRSYYSADITQLCGDPRLETGDIISLECYGNTYTVPIMNVEREFDGGLSCKFNSYEPVKEINLTLAQKVELLTQETKKQKSHFTEAQTTLAENMMNALGLFTTTEQMADGSVKYYFHNKTDIKESTYIITFNSNGFAWTDKYEGDNTTWHYGIDSDGNAVLNTLALHGLVADWIKAGTLQSLNGSTFFNLDKGEIGSETVEEAVYIFCSNPLNGYTKKTLKKTSKLTFEAGSLVQSVTLESAEGELIDSYILSLGLFADVQKGMTFEHSSTYFNKTGKFYFKKPDDWDSKSEIAKAALLIAYYATAQMVPDGIILTDSDSGAVSNLSSKGWQLIENTGNENTSYFITQADKNGIVSYTADAEGNATEPGAGFMTFDKGDGTRLYGNISDVYAFRNGATALPAFTKDYFEISDNSPGKLDLEEIFGSILEQTGAVHIRARITLMHYNGNSEYIILWNTTSEQIFIDCRHITGSSSSTGYVKTPVLQGINNEGTLSKALTIGERPIFYGTSLDIVPKVAGTDVDSYVAAVVEVLTYR